MNCGLCLQLILLPAAYVFASIPSTFEMNKDEYVTLLQVFQFESEECMRYEVSQYLATDVELLEYIVILSWWTL
jgi:hypothetical protein